MTVPRSLLLERYLAYLTQIERSPDTVKAYAHDLKDWFALGLLLDVTDISGRTPDNDRE